MIQRKEILPTQPGAIMKLLWEKLGPYYELFGKAIDAGDGTAAMQRPYQLDD